MASTTTSRPPTRWMTRSGRSAPSATRTCSRKSQRSTSPASSTARRRWSSPHRPRTCGLRSAVDRVRVSCWSSVTCWRSSPCQLARCRSRSIIWSLSRSRPCITSAWSTIPAATDGRDRAHSSPSAPPSSSPTDQQPASSHRERPCRRVHAGESAAVGTDNVHGVAVASRDHVTDSDPAQSAGHDEPAGGARATTARRDTSLLAVGSLVSGLLAYVFFALVTRALGAGPAAPVAVLWAWWSFAGAAITFPVQHWISRTAALAGRRGRRTTRAAPGRRRGRRGVGRRGGAGVAGERAAVRARRRVVPAARRGRRDRQRSPRPGPRHPERPSPVRRGRGGPARRERAALRGGRRADGLRQREPDGVRRRPGRRWRGRCCSGRPPSCRAAPGPAASAPR